MTIKQVLNALVVDDETAMQRLICRALIKRGFTCVTACDGREAEEEIADREFDVVVTDLKMPNENGHALAVKLLSLERRPVIVIHTGIIEPRLAQDLLRRGVDDIVFKPFDFEILATKVKTLVDRKLASLAQEMRPSAPAVVATDDIVEATLVTE